MGLVIVWGPSFVDATANFVNEAAKALFRIADRARRCGGGGGSGIFGLWLGRKEHRLAWKPNVAGRRLKRRLFRRVHNFWQLKMHFEDTMRFALDAIEMSSLLLTLLHSGLLLDALLLLFASVGRFVALSLSAPSLCRLAALLGHFSHAVHYRLPFVRRQRRNISIAIDDLVFRVEHVFLHRDAAVLRQLIENLVHVKGLALVLRKSMGNAI